MHGEYYQGSSLPASLGRGHKPTQASQPIANKDAMASMATLVGDDASILEKLDSSESKSLETEFNFRPFPELTEHLQSRRQPSHQAS